METQTTFTNPSTEPQKAVYAAEMQRIFDHALIGKESNGQWCRALNGPQNIWRSSWAFDTLIDYLATMKKIDPSYSPPDCSGESFLTFSLSRGLDPASGNWWDDFGWLGIVSLRAAEMSEMSKEQKSDLVKKAVNSWCYMYGNGWKNGTSPDQWGNFSVPFTDQWGKPGTEDNIGAPNSFTYAMQEGHDPERYQPFEPMYTPGGIWNAMIIGNDAKQQPQYGPTCSYLAPVQNTVTNALFMLLTLRVYRALNGEYAGLVKEGDINVNAIRTMLDNQLSWIQQWFDREEEDSLLLTLAEDKVMVRERVARYRNGMWDSAFYSGLCWTGDQGIMLAALCEAGQWMETEQIKADSSWLSKYKSIMNAVRTTMFSEEGIEGLGAQLRPWINKGAFNEFDLFPQGDDADYQTGVAVYLRYLEQQLAVNPQLADLYRDAVFTAANAICRENYPSPSGYAAWTCEGMVVQYTNDSPDRREFNKLTPWINRIALLSMAIRLSE